jgi:RNA polymerase sigma-70 factor, ECF subfamily
MLVAVAAEPESATEASDAELAGRVRGGDRAAEAELFRRLAPRVRLYGLRHLRDPAAADDLVQDVLLMTFDSLRAGKVREDERLASNVLGTCRRMAIGLARSATRRQRLLERFGPELAPAAWTFDPPSLDLDRLVSCLERLAERERSVVVLSFYADRGAAEIVMRFSRSGEVTLGADHEELWPGGAPGHEVVLARPLNRQSRSDITLGFTPRPSVASVAWRASKTPE